MEADPQRRKEYQRKLSKVARSNIVYIDESGIDVSTTKERGWALAGSILPGKKSGKYYQRVNVVAGIVNNKIIAPLLFHDTCNANLFNTWVEQCLVQCLEPGQVVVMDNATFHKSAKTKTLIESAGCSILFLPPYSPDLNPIEKFWANMKRWIKQKRHLFSNLYHALFGFFSVT